MGALSDSIPVFMELDVGSLFFHLLDPVEGLPVDDRRVMVLGPDDFIWIVPGPLHGRMLGTYRLSIDRFYRILFIGSKFLALCKSSNPLTPIMGFT